MSRTPDSRLRNEGFRKAETSLRLEGMDPSGTPLYESVKARIISGELTYEQGRSEIFAYYTKSDTAGPVTVGEMLIEEFLKPLSMSGAICRCCKIAQSNGVSNQREKVSLSSVMKFDHLASLFHQGPHRGCTV